MPEKLSKSASQLRNFWKYAALVVLVIEIIGVVRLGYLEIKSTYGLSLTELIGLLAGADAFLAVMIQIEDQQNARKQEQEAEKRALARALLFEIDHFYRSYLTTTLTLVKGTAGKEVNSTAGLALSVAMRIEPAPFDIYQGNTEKLGSLGLETAISAIRFYKLAADLKDHVRRYMDCLSGGHISQPFTTPIENVTLNLKIGALETCSWLCQAANLPFSSVDIAVASEITQIKELAVSKGVPVHLPEFFGQAGH